MAEKDNGLIAAVRALNLNDVRELLNQGANIQQVDDHGWTPLCWAAAQGHIEIARELVNKGADPFCAGKDGRTPYSIAIAAGRLEVARYLREVEEQRGGDLQRCSSRQSELRPYCRAYSLQKLRQFSKWQEGLEDQPVSGGFEPLVDSTVLFLHRDLTVTRSVWPGEQVVFSRLTEDWRTFCVEVLNFLPPSDFELAPQAESDCKLTQEPGVQRA